jgi:lipopolysaccharide export system protein LptA
MNRKTSILVTSLLLGLSSPLSAYGEAAPAPSEDVMLDTEGLFELGNGSEPTIINSDSLQLNSETRVFTYKGNVHVVQGDMTLTSEELEGRYNQANEIQQLVARNNVHIVKGEKINATSNKAVYTAANEILTLTENPEILQGASVLTADVVKIYLKENRSEAEGQVRVKLIKDDKAKEKSAPTESKPETKQQESTTGKQPEASTTNS